MTTHTYTDSGYNMLVGKFLKIKVMDNEDYFTKKLSIEK